MSKGQIRCLPLCPPNLLPTEVARLWQWRRHLGAQAGPLRPSLSRGALPRWSFDFQAAATCPPPAALGLPDTVLSGRLTPSRCGMRPCGQAMGPSPGGQCLGYQRATPATLPTTSTSRFPVRLATLPLGLHRGPAPQRRSVSTGTPKVLHPRGGMAPSQGEATHCHPRGGPWPHSDRSPTRGPCGSTTATSTAKPPG
jgi:hypothetical protein